MAADSSKKLYFVSFCIEQYKNAHGMSGSDVIELFDNAGVTKYLLDNYDILHTQGANWLLAEIDDYLKK